MTPAQYATHRGCSDSYVRRLRRKGQLVVQGTLIDAAASDLVLDAMLDPVRGGDRTSPLGDGVGAAPKTAAVLTVPAGPSVHEAVRRERLAKARLAELELGEQAGELTRIARSRRGLAPSLDSGTPLARPTCARSWTASAITHRCAGCLSGSRHRSAPLRLASTGPATSSTAALTP